MIFIPPALFLALLGWLLRKFGPSRVSKEPKAMKDIFWATTGISAITILFTAFLAILAGISESKINWPAVTTIDELKNDSRYIIIKAKVSENTVEKPFHTQLAAYYDRGATGQQDLTISLEGGDALIWNGDYETIFWKGQVDKARTIFALNKHEIIVVGGLVTHLPSADYELTQIRADFVLSGDLVDYKWYIRSIRVYPSLLAMLIALCGLGNLIYAFAGLRKLRIDLKGNKIASCVESDAQATESQTVESNINQPSKEDN